MAGCWKTEPNHRISFRTIFNKLVKSCAKDKQKLLIESDAGDEQRLDFDSDRHSDDYLAANHSSNAYVDWVLDKCSFTQNHCSIQSMLFSDHNKDWHCFHCCNFCHFPYVHSIIRSHLSEPQPVIRFIIERWETEYIDLLCWHPFSSLLNLESIFWSLFRRNCSKFWINLGILVVID